MRLCGCICAKDLPLAEKILDASSAVDLIEVRIDRFDEPGDGITFIKNHFHIPLVATFRRARDHGKQIDEKKRIRLLEDAIRSGASYIDLESDLPDDTFSWLAGIIHKKGGKVICSFHDFFKTPDRNELRKISGRVMKKGDLGKIVTTAHSIDDCHRVLELILGKDNLIAFCMGSEYRFTRMMSLVYGSPLGYCRMESPAGEGQFSPDEMRDILKRVIL